MALGGEFQEQLNNLRYTFASALTTGSRALINNWSLLIRLKSSQFDRLQYILSYDQFNYRAVRTIALHIKYMASALWRCTSASFLQGQFLSKDCFFLFLFFKVTDVFITDESAQNTVRSFIVMRIKCLVTIINKKRRSCCFFIFNQQDIFISFLMICLWKWCSRLDKTDVLWF